MVVRRAMRVLLGLGVFGAAWSGSAGEVSSSGLPVAVAHAEETAESCLGFQKSDMEKGISFDVESSCGMKLACKVSWSVVCSENDGTVTSRSAKSERFGLAGGDKHSVPMSAASCQQSWKVEDVRWGCDPVTK